MTRSDEAAPASVALPVPLSGAEREEAERIVRSTRLALADAFERLGGDAAPRVPAYAVYEASAS